MYYQTALIRVLLHEALPILNFDETAPDMPATMTGFLARRPVKYAAKAASLIRKQHGLESDSMKPLQTRCNALQRTHQLLKHTSVRGRAHTRTPGGSLSASGLARRWARTL